MKSTKQIKAQFQDIYNHIEQMAEHGNDQRKLLPFSEKSERVSRSKYDPQFFYKTYLGKTYFKNDPAPYHLQLPTLFEFKQRPLIIIAPRSGAKTTFLVGETLRRIATGIERFMIRVEESEKIANKEIFKIRHEIETNRQLFEDFGDLRSNPWQALELYFSNGTMLWGRGLDQPIRGISHKEWRPTGIIYNDVETPKQVQNQTLTDEIYDSLLTDVLPSLNYPINGGGFLAVVGTLLGKQSMLSRLRYAPMAKVIEYPALEGEAEIIELLLSKVSRDMNEIEEYMYHIEGHSIDDVELQRAFFTTRKDYKDLIDSVTSFWPAQYPVADLLLKAASIGIPKFKQEYLHIPIGSDGGSLIDPDWFERDDSQYNIHDISEENLVRAVFLDPSYRDSKTSDDKAFVTMFYDTNSKVGYVIDVTAGKISFDDMIARSFSLTKKYLLGDVTLPGRVFPKEAFIDTLFGYEDNGAQQWLNSIFRDNSLKYGISLPKLTGITHTGKKETRIGQLSYYLERNRIKFDFESDQQKLLRNELCNLGNRRMHDDRADALEGCWSLVEKIHSHVIYGAVDTNLTLPDNEHRSFREPIYKKEYGRAITDRLKLAKSRWDILGSYVHSKTDHQRGYRKI
jgi:hypothetical protein